MTKRKKNGRSTRTKIRSELSNFNTENVDTRRTRFVESKNRYSTMLDLKKREKLLRNQRKNAKYHIGNRRKLKKRSELEMEYMTSFE
ncbi:MAG: hypothetical protein GY870_19470 [archaeon]|nr:hypothetical protein [archaeon]